MARKQTTKDRSAEHRSAGADAPDQPCNARRSAKPSALLDTRFIYCGDTLVQLRKLLPCCRVELL